MNPERRVVREGRPDDTSTRTPEFHPGRVGGGYGRTPRGTGDVSLHHRTPGPSRTQTRNRRTVFRLTHPRPVTRFPCRTRDPVETYDTHSGRHTRDV